MGQFAIGRVDLGELLEALLVGVEIARDLLHQIGGLLAFGGGQLLQLHGLEEDRLNDLVDPLDQLLRVRARAADAQHHRIQDARELAVVRRGGEHRDGVVAAFQRLRLLGEKHLEGLLLALGDHAHHAAGLVHQLLEGLLFVRREGAVGAQLLELIGEFLDGAEEVLGRLLVFGACRRLGKLLGGAEKLGDRRFGPGPRDVVAGVGEGKLGDLCPGEEGAQPARLAEDLGPRGALIAHRLERLGGLIVRLLGLGLEADDRARERAGILLKRSLRRVEPLDAARHVGNQLAEGGQPVARLYQHLALTGEQVLRGQI